MNDELYCDICDQLMDDLDPDVRSNGLVVQCGPCSRNIDIEYGYSHA